MSDLPIVANPESFKFLDYIKDTFPVSFIGLFLFLAGFAVAFIVLVKYWRWLVDRISSFK